MEILRIILIVLPFLTLPCLISATSIADLSKQLNEQNAPDGKQHKNEELGMGQTRPKGRMPRPENPPNNALPSCLRPQSIGKQPLPDSEKPEEPADHPMNKP